jgi:hypothetical protein
MIAELKTAMGILLAHGLLPAARQITTGNEGKYS